MPRLFHRKWLGLFALTLIPGLASAQAAAPQTHTVRKGDTLWDLAKQYRGDPFLWPDLYRINTSVVEDPHWIYPGEVLSLTAADSVKAVPATDTPEPPAPVAAEPTDSAVLTRAVAQAPTDTTAVVDSSEAPAPTGDVPSDSSAEPQQKTLAQLTAVSANQQGEEPGLFGPRRTKVLEESLKAYTHQPYRALRRSEFYSSGFLTENDNLPFGKVLGPVIPQQIRASSANASALPYALIAIDAPRNATYQIGDTLLVVQVGAELGNHGNVVIPTGLAQVTDTVQGRYVASVVATYGPIRLGQRVLPAEKFTPSGEAHAVPVTDGVRATFLGGPNRQDLKAPQMVVFLDKGRREGVAAGDMFEIRRRPERLADGRQLINDVMATLQVVHVREHTATARVLNVLSPDIAPGADARQVAKLPS
ncbi:MAG TPA: LysM peptidoglycan-binding domain-containing protein [Gemmatimonadales bacterium]|nr:LysM peptidoglycan-binding domain-containing protein [Gemmatimonadales bacterium]